MLHSLPELAGTRIRLRELRDDDAVLLLELYGDPAVMRFTDEEPFPDLATAGHMLGSVRRLLAEGSSLEWALVLHDSDTLIGTCGLHSFARDRRSAEIGCLLRRSAWGKGYMTEAIDLLTDYARGALRLDGLKADVCTENRQAQRLFYKLGFQQVDAATWMIALDG